MEFEDLKKISREDLKALLNEKKEELRVLRFKASAQQLKQLHVLKNVRREIAQILSILNSPQTT